MIRAVIVDDEAPARQKIRRYLDEEADVDVVAEAGDGAAAADAIQRLAPDLVFLDVMMPEMDGFELLRQLPVASLPDVVFITAHDEHAVRAFDVNAVDYLLKPVDRDRFRRALDRIRLRRAADVGSSGRVERALRAIAPVAPFVERLLIPAGTRTRLLDVARIDWGETAGNYTAIHAGAETHVLRQPMSRLLERLDPQRFVRVHRLRFVNIERVLEWTPLSHGDLQLTLTTGTTLALSRRYRDAFLSRSSSPKSRSSHPAR